MSLSHLTRAGVRLRRSLAGVARWALPAVLVFAAMPLAHADRITTHQGQALEGVVTEENPYYVHIDVRGVVVPVPRERIKSISKATLEDNVRMLLDRAREAESRDDLGTARTLVEQARRLNTSDATLVQDLAQLDRDLTDMEKRGGTPEARRARAEVLIQRAREAYDKIRVDEGDSLLLQALKTDPTYTEAHALINEKLTTPGQRPDLLLAAEYFSEALWPNNVTLDNPVVPLLPEIYEDLLDRFDRGTDIPRAQRYAELLRVLDEAFRTRPELKVQLTDAQRQLLATPLVDQLTEIIRRNIDRAEYEFALQKLSAWADPLASADMTLLFTRAWVGNGNFDEAAAALAKAHETFPENQSLLPHLNAVNLLITAEKAQQEQNVTQAIADYEKVFAARENLVREVGQMSGARLAMLKAPLLDDQASTAPLWLKADTAAQIFRFGGDSNMRRRAAELLLQTLPRLPWRLDLKFTINDTPIDLGPAQHAMVQAAIARPLNVAFDPQSSFALDFTIGLQVDPTSAPLLMQALDPNTGASIAAPLNVTGLRFNLIAAQPSLGILYQSAWAEPGPAPAAQARLSAAGYVAPEGQPLPITQLKDVTTLNAFLEQDVTQFVSARISLLNPQLQLQDVAELLRER